MPIQRPSWLPTYIPELQGLRGLAVLSVVIYHCHPRLEGTWVHYASLWGWAGVNLFFVLSGFLITSILLESREHEEEVDAGPSPQAGVVDRRADKPRMAMIDDDR